MPGVPWQMEQIEVMRTNSLVRCGKRNVDPLKGTEEHGVGRLDGQKESLDNSCSPPVRPVPPTHVYASYVPCEVLHIGGTLQLCSH